MKRLLLLTFIFSSCITQSFVEQKQYDSFPEGVSIIEATCEGDMDTVLEKFYSILLDEGFRVSKYDKENHLIYTEGKDIGQSTLTRLNVRVKKYGDNSSLLIIRPEWKPGTRATAVVSFFINAGVNPQWENAKVRWSSGRIRYTFAYSYSLAKRMSDMISFR